ncbi:MAG: glutamine-hydrolyzing GMP synthase, partial [Hyphomicrobiales bacterium]
MAPPNPSPNHSAILIVDFGSQWTQLIARRVREANVFCEIVPFHQADSAFKRLKPKGVILSGGPASVADDQTPRAPDIVFSSGVPVLGICYGQMAMAAQLGGVVEQGHTREFGRAEVDVIAESALFEGVWRKGERHTVWMSHGDRVTKLPEGFARAATSANAPLAVLTDEKRRYFGLMFHPEVVHTPDGAKLLANFVHRIAGCPADWTMAAYREEAIAKIRAQVGSGKVICGLSGGVDS